MLLREVTAAKNDGALSYYRVSGLFFVAVIFTAAILLHTYQIV